MTPACLADFHSAPEDGGPEIFVHKDDFIEPSLATEESPASLFFSSDGRREREAVGTRVDKECQSLLSGNVGRRRGQRSARSSVHDECKSGKERSQETRVVRKKATQLRRGQLLSFEAAWDARHNAPKAVRVVSLDEFGV